MIDIPDVFQPLFNPMRYKIYHGGRGGAKSWNFARSLLIIAAKRRRLVLCTRELQGSIHDSVHRLLSNQITDLKLDKFYTIKQNYIKGLNGSLFIFEGLKNNITKIKSMEGVDVVWCEEAEKISEYSWDVLLPTIRKRGSEIWISFNPHDELDYTYQQFVVKPPKDALVKQVSYKDNPYFPEELEKERLRCLDEYPRKYAHIWEGEPLSDYEDSIIMPEWVNAAVDAHKKLGFRPMGIKSVGFDPADQGKDNKAICYRHGSVVLEAKEWGTGDITDSIDKAFEYAYEKRADVIVYDSIGIGAAVKASLTKLDGKIENHGFCGSERPRNRYALYSDGRRNEDVFRNLRAQFWWQLRDRFEKTHRAITKGTYIDPDHLISLDSSMTNLSTLKAELSRVQRKRGQNSFIQVESKKDMLSRGMNSPNLADALVMAFGNPDVKRTAQKLPVVKLAIV